MSIYEEFEMVDNDFKIVESNLAEYLTDGEETLKSDYFNLLDDLTEFETIKANISQQEQNDSKLVNDVFLGVNEGNVFNCDNFHQYFYQASPYATKEFRGKTHSAVRETLTGFTNNSCLCEDDLVFPGNSNWNDSQNILRGKHFSDDTNKNETNTSKQNATLLKLRIKLKELRKERGQEEYIPDFKPKPPVEPSAEEKHKAEDLKQRNRQSACRSRENVKNKIENLKRTISTLEKENKILLENIKYVKKRFGKQRTTFPERGCFFTAKCFPVFKRELFQL